jgi:NAD(P)-dependent dehydrogenase (short-subunit alcohol dehydrogenase family)
MTDLTGQTAIITGASRGIGLAIAERLLSAGANVCLTARREQDLETALDRLGAGPRAIAVAGASDDEAHRAETVSRTVKAFGRLDLLVNNAATNPVYGPLVEADAGALRKILEVNVIAPQAWIHAAWNASMADHGGAILNVASLSGVAIEPNLGPYGVSKAALIHLTRQLALELGPHVRVNALAPGVVKTRFARALYEGREDAVAATYPLQRLGVPADVASAAVFLLSNDAAWITGQTLLVDGGISLTTAFADTAVEA